MAPIILRYDSKLKFSSCGDDFFFANYTQINNIILEFSRENTCRVFFYSRLYCCPWVVFSQSVALKIKNPQKQKSKRFNFALAFDLFVLKMGIEPTLPKELDFESSASTNSAT